jgi:hypothetical protein
MSTRIPFFKLLDLDLVGDDLGLQGSLDRLLLPEHAVVRGLHDAAAEQPRGQGCTERSRNRLRNHR